MQFARDLQQRLQHAAALRASLWITALALGLGGCVAWTLVYLLPVQTDDVAKARALGIVSETVLAGHSKSADSRAYTIAFTSALLTSVAIWTAWAIRAGPKAVPSSPVETPSHQRLQPLELAIAALIAFGVFARIWNGRAATLSAWSALSEEGEMLAWVNTVLRGKALARDTFCLYGPLSVWAVAALFHLFHPSIGLWRCWIFGLNAPALLVTYLFLRGITRMRITAAAGALAIGILCVGAVPAMSWSLSRVGLGLAALAALNRALERETRTWYVITGALAATALLYSPEIGISCAFAIAPALLLIARRWIAIFSTILGVLIVMAPATLYLVASGSLGSTIHDAILFSRVRVLGFGALVFPGLALTVESLRAYFTPAVLVVAAFFTATKLLRGERDRHVLIEMALVIFGVVLFNVAVSRPDDVHLPFVAPPALILLVVMLENAWFELRSPKHRVTVFTAFIAGAAALLVWSATASKNVRSLFELPSGRKLALPRGGNALFPEEFANDLEQITRAIESRTTPDEPVWIFPNEALLYFLADRPQPTHFPLAIFAVTRGQREELIADLERARPRWAVVFPYAPLHDRVPFSEALPEVIAYLNANYEFDRNIGAFVLLHRKS